MLAVQGLVVELQARLDQVCHCVLTGTRVGRPSFSLTVCLQCLHCSRSLFFSFSFQTSRDDVLQGSCHARADHNNLHQLCTNATTSLGLPLPCPVEAGRDGRILVHLADVYGNPAEMEAGMLRVGATPERSTEAIPMTQMVRAWGATSWPSLDLPLPCVPDQCRDCPTSSYLFFVCAGVGTAMAHAGSMQAVREPRTGALTQGLDLPTSPAAFTSKTRARAPTFRSPAFPLQPQSCLGNGTCSVKLEGLVTAGTFTLDVAYDGEPVAVLPAATAHVVGDWRRTHTP